MHEFCSRDKLGYAMVVNDPHLVLLSCARYQRRILKRFPSTLFVGNKAEYARYALGSDNSNILPYFEQLKDIAELVFNRKPDLRIAATQVLPPGESTGREAPAQGSRYKRI